MRLGTDLRDPQVPLARWQSVLLALHRVGMYNIVYFQDLRAAGAATPEIRSALGCCLLKLDRGVYSVIRRCQVSSHRRFTRFALDEAWMDYHEAGRHRERSQQRKYREHLDRLRILHYPHYRPDDVVWGVSAARLHKLGTFDVPTQPVNVAHPVSSCRTGSLIRRRISVRTEDVSEVAGIRVTTPAKTALALKTALGPAAAFAAMEQVLRWSLLGTDEEAIFKTGYPPQVMSLVHGAVDGLFGPPIARMSRGKKSARTLAALITPLSESYAESRASFNLHLLGLHDFVQQVDVKEGHRTLTRLDLLFEDGGVALYVDGTQKYVDGGFNVMNKESWQHNRLLSMGYKVIRFKFKEVMNVATFSRKLFDQAPELKARCRKKLVL
ncbi:hypothetical protein BANT918_02863 [Brevibacterium antiquum CNRZ 918]|uniref:DUF559 domain-containing protein n=2 Tax=Brevibacteriaceae TaxID=85019 RepID=A0A2H1KVH4_9MICO|nr:hypothetical protein BANT918_02863 [Brevibacterium antiquum CNRZ 918]